MGKPFLGFSKRLWEKWETCFEVFHVFHMSGISTALFFQAFLEFRDGGPDKFYFHKRRYGAKRLSGELRDEGVKAGYFLVSRVMREERLVARQPKRFRPQTTDSSGTRRPSPNLLKDIETKALGAGEVLVGDITYLAMTGGRFCYLAMFQDVRTKRLAGWSVSQRMTAGLVTDALKMALRRGFVRRNAIIHTDRGSQYASNEFRPDRSMPLKAVDVGQGQLL